MLRNHELCELAEESSFSKQRRYRFNTTSDFEVNLLRRCNDCLAFKLVAGLNRASSQDRSRILAAHGHSLLYVGF